MKSFIKDHRIGRLGGNVKIPKLIKLHHLTKAVHLINGNYYKKGLILILTKKFQLNFI